MPAQPAFWSPRFEITHRADGSILMAQCDPLGEIVRALPDRLIHWADTAPDRICLARRGADGDWRRLDYASVLGRVRSLATRLVGLGLGPDRPVLILSENSLEHALLGLACQYAGVPYAPVSVAYSLVSSDHGKLKSIAALLRPGLIFAQDGARYAAALAAIGAPGVPVLVAENPVAEASLFADFESIAPGPEAEAALAALTPDMVAKYLFTSGSTGSPKAVINTHLMLMSNMAMVADCFRFLEDHPPVLVDWAPWNHTASGNKVFNMTIYHGGTFHIDDGKPAPGPFAETIRNLKEVSPTWYFTVPLGWDMLVRELERDAELCRSFFARLDMMMYAGAGMAQHSWDAVLRLARKYAGRDVLLTSGLGATETAPAALMCTEQWASAGNIGVPERGLTLKLVPNGDKLEARVKGPSITPGYYGDAAKTAEAFDSEGFYMLGDALKPADPDDLSKGFFFDGRVAENFKLRTGTWVAVGALRAALVNHFGAVVRDAVITGDDEAFLGALLFVNEAPLRDMVGGDEPFALLLRRADVVACFAERLAAFAAAQTGSATRVKRVLLLSEPPDLDKGEVTDKGSINQRAVKMARQDAVRAIYQGGDGVISV